MSSIEFRIYLLITVICLFSCNSASTKSGSVSVNDIDMYYEVHGEGEPLLLLHGWTQSSKFWEPYIETYSQYYRVYSLDLRGHGSTTPLSEGFNISLAAKDIHAFMKVMNIESANAVGLSFGGLVLLELLNSHPENLESVVLVAVSHDYSGDQNNEMTISFETLPEAFKEELYKIHMGGESQIRALFNPKLNYRIGISNDDLMTMETRTLIVQGEKDEILGTESAIHMDRLMPNSELWLVKNSGHVPVTKANRSLFLEKTKDFLLNR